MGFIGMRLILTGTSRKIFASFRASFSSSFLPASQENTNLAEYCSPGADAAMGRAESLATSDPGGAQRQWAEVDRMLTDAAPWAPLYNPRVPIAIGARVGNYEFHPFWTVLLDQLWVR